MVLSQSRPNPWTGGQSSSFMFSAPISRSLKCSVSLLKMLRWKCGRPSSAVDVFPFKSQVVNGSASKTGRHWRPIGLGLVSVTSAAGHGSMSTTHGDSSVVHHPHSILAPCPPILKYLLNLLFSSSTEHSSTSVVSPFDFIYLFKLTQCRQRIKTVCNKRL